MNILMAIDSLGGGGAEKVVLNLSRSLVEMGHFVIILSVRERTEHKIDFPIKIETLRFSKQFRAYSKFSRLLKEKISRLESEHGKFDLIVSHLNLSNRLFHKAGIPDAFYCLHSALSPANIGVRRGLRKIVKLRRVRAILNGKDIITVSEGIMHDLKNEIGVRAASIRTIYNAVDFFSIQRQAQLPNPFHGEEYILHVGRFTREKRHDRLLDAYSKSGIREKLVLLGDGPLRAEMELLARQLNLEEKVIFAGFIPNPYPVMKEASLLVLCSDFEGLPTVLLEALSLDTAVVSTNCPTGPGEILRGRSRRYLVPADPEILARTLKCALADVESGGYPFNDIDLTRFEPRNVAQKYINLVNSSRSLPSE